MNREDIKQVGTSPVSRRSMESYVLTYSRLRKREPLIALGSHQGTVKLNEPAESRLVDVLSAGAAWRAMS